MPYNGSRSGARLRSLSSRARFVNGPSPLTLALSLRERGLERGCRGDRCQIQPCPTGNSIRQSYPCNASAACPQHQINPLFSVEIGLGNVASHRGLPLTLALSLRERGLERGCRGDCWQTQLRLTGSTRRQAHSGNAHAAPSTSRQCPCEQSAATPDKPPRPFGERAGVRGGAATPHSNPNIKQTRPVTEEANHDD